MRNWMALFFIGLLSSCVNDSYSDLTQTETSINLKWNKAYADDTVDKSLIGLKWALSYLGATLPNPDAGFSVDGNIIRLEINKAGFSQDAQEQLLKLSKKIKQSGEYRSQNNIDLGRYVTLLLGSSAHYYEFVRLPQTLNEVLVRYVLLEQEGYVNNSAVSLENRIIGFSAQNGFDQLFLSKETDPETHEIYEYETIELLANGQLRFGIFDTNGNRKDNADPSHSNAGKPAKCMWCHESNINPLFTAQQNFYGYLPAADLQNFLVTSRENNKALQLSLRDGVDFSQTQQHTLTELLYISFMEPSAERLSAEWQMPLEQVQQLLSGLPAHVQAEFPYLGNLYNRRDIETFAPFQGLPVSSSVREASAIEVNHLN